MPVSAIAAAIVAWFAFRRPTLNGLAVGIALVILVTPFILLALVDPKEGLDMAFSNYSPWLLSVVVGIGIVIPSVRRLWRES